jgi:hypothetical protein
MHVVPRMDEQDRIKLSGIDETLKKLRAWWREPSKTRTDYNATSVTAADAETHHQNVALIAELEKLEAERSRLHSLVMDGQPANAAELQALASQAERLRVDFTALMT